MRWFFKTQTWQEILSQQYWCAPISTRFTSLLPTSRNPFKQSSVIREILLPNWARNMRGMQNPPPEHHENCKIDIRESINHPSLQTPAINHDNTKAPTTTSQLITTRTASPINKPQTTNQITNSPPHQQPQTTNHQQPHHITNHK